METKTRVLIADSSDDYRNLMALFLRDEDDMELVGSAKDGTEALCMLEDLKPDVLLTEMALPGLDGLNLLKKLPEVSPDTRSIVVTALYNSRMISECLGLGAYYVMLKPCDAVSIISNIRLFTSPAARPPQPAEQESGNEQSLEVMVTEIIHEIGVPAHIKGYQYLREAIIIAIKDMETINAVTKVLYPAVARRFNTTPLPRRAGDKARDRSRLGQGRYRDPPALLRLYRFQHKGQADQFGIHRHDCRLPQPPSQNNDHKISCLRSAPGKSPGRFLYIFFTHCAT